MIPIASPSPPTPVPIVPIIVGSGTLSWAHHGSTPSLLIPTLARPDAQGYGWDRTTAVQGTHYAVVEKYFLIVLPYTAPPPPAWARSSLSLSPCRSLKSLHFSPVSFQTLSAPSPLPSSSTSPPSPPSLSPLPSPPLCFISVPLPSPQRKSTLPAGPAQIMLLTITLS